MLNALTICKHKTTIMTKIEQYYAQQPRSTFDFKVFEQ